VGFNFLAAPRPSGLDYSDFLQRVEDGQVTGTLKVSATSVSGTYDEDGDTVSSPPRSRRPIRGRRS
jgi:hypothetical protein